MRLRVMRGDEDANNRYLGKDGELTYDTTNKALRIHDGVIDGGHFVRDVLAQTAANVNSTIGTSFLNHSFSNEHDGRYYTKSELIAMFAEIENNISQIDLTIDAQDSILKVGGDDFGWKELQTTLNMRRYSNTNSKTFRDKLKAYAFSPSRDRSCGGDLIIPTDYANDTHAFPFISWSINRKKGNKTVRWGFEFSVAKGFDQGDGSILGPSSIVYKTVNVTDDMLYKHQITHMNDIGIDPSLLEPGSVIILRVFRDWKNDTYAADTFGFKVGMHYQTSRLAVKNRLPPYYT